MFEESHLNSVRTQPSSSNASPINGDVEPLDIPEETIKMLRDLDYISQPLISKKNSKKRMS